MSGLQRPPVVADGSCARDAQLFACKRSLADVSRVLRAQNGLLTVGIHKREDVEIVVVQEGLCSVVPVLVTLHKLLGNVLNGTSPD